MTFVTGMYTCWDDPYLFVLRFDFDRPGVAEAGLNIVSGDVFLGNRAILERHQLSLVSVTNGVQVAADGSISSAFRARGPAVGGRIISGTLQCSLQPPGTPNAGQVDASLVFDEHLGSRSIRMKKRAHYLRTVDCEFDHQQGLTNLAVLPAVKSRVIANFARNRIGLIPHSNEDSEVISSLAEWSESDLRTILNTTNSRLYQPDLARWRAYVFFASKFREVSHNRITTGVMFDNHVTDTHQRQGCAVFWNSLQELQGGVNFERDLAWTATHELGHTFNLIHTFEHHAHGRQSKSYMNYPDEYPDGADAYFRDLSGNFDIDELVFVRHALLPEVVMGGQRFGGAAYASVLRDIVRAQPDAGLQLKLRLKPDALQNTLEFGSPVVVELKLSNTSGEALPVMDNLDPVHRKAVYLIKQPSGRVISFSPMYLRCSRGGERELPKGGALYESVNLTFGSDGFYFLEPGKYEIQALNEQGERSLRSNILQVWIRFPDRLVEDLIVPTLDIDVGNYLATWGDRSLRDSVEQKMQDVQAHYPTHPLAVEFSRCRAYEAARPAVVAARRPKPGTFKCKIAKPETDAIEQMRVALDLQPDFTSQPVSKPPVMSNLTYMHLAGTLAGRLKKDGNDREAAEAFKAGIRYHDLHNDKPMRPAMQTRLRKRWLG